MTFDTFAFHKPALAASPDGALHLAFSLNDSPSTVQYARCAGDCGLGANWAVAILGSGQFTGSVRLVVGSDGRVHVLYETSGTSSSPELHYATCATNCAQAGSWSDTNLASLFAGAWSSPTGGSPLVIDSQNRLYFTVDRSTFTDGGFTLATCGGDCTAVANWSMGRIRASGRRTALVAQGTTLHQLVDNDSPAANSTALTYRTCASDCTLEASWRELPNFFVYDGANPVAIATTAQGGVRVVYNQGTAAPTQSAEIRAQDNRLLFWSCEANCTQAGSWGGMTSGAVGEGSAGISMVQFGAATVVAVTNSADLSVYACGQDCLTASNWQVGVVDSAEAMTASYDPISYIHATCSGDPPQSASWHLSDGTLAVRPDGAVAVAHVASILRICPGSTGPVYIPGFGRLVYLP